MESFQYRPFHLGDERVIADLLVQVFDGWPHFDLDCTPLDHWNWKYMKNPLGRSPIALCVNKEEIIGCSHTSILRIKVEDQVLRCCNGYDLAVHPNFRRKGVTTHLHQYRKELRIQEGVKFAFKFPGPQFMVKYTVKRYPRFPFVIKDFIIIKDFDLHLENLPTSYATVKKYGYYFLSMLNQIRHLFKSDKANNDKLIIKEVESFNIEIDHFWSEIEKYYKLIVERKKDYLNWRYCDSFGGDYCIKIVEENGKILGFSVLRINKYVKEYPIGYIVDLLALPNRLDAYESLISDALDYFNENNINLCSCYAAKDSHLEMILRRCGFIDRQHRLPIFYEVLSNDMKELDFRKIPSEKVHFSYGDIDYI